MQKVTKKHARTHKKLPVASFCASETAETGRIANGREQGDHVSRRQGGKGFNFVSEKLVFGRAASRFGEPRSSFWEGFNFVSAKPPLRRAESRFAEPRCSLQRERVYSFRLYEKNGEYPRGLRTSGLPGTIQSFAGNIFEEASDNTSRNRLFAQNGGEKALNRCEIQALQRKDLERTAKEEPCSLRTVGYGWVGICGVSSEKGLR